MPFATAAPQLKSADLPLWNRALEMADPEDIIRWSLAVYGNRLTMGTGFGASGLVLLDMTIRVNPNVDVFFIDTSMLFPETYELKDRLEARYQMQFRRVAGIGLAAQTAQYGDLLWETAPDLCCGMRKVRPLAAALDGRGAWMAALRRDQSSTRSDTPILQWNERHQVAKIAPLARWSEADCWRYIHHHNLPYNPLHDHGYPSIGCAPCTRSVLPGEDLRAGRWAGHQQKTECGLHFENGQMVRNTAL
jgi:phosphoadenosine phosphosulfate reductase